MKLKLKNLVVLFSIFLASLPIGNNLYAETMPIIIYKDSYGEEIINSSEEIPENLLQKINFELFSQDKKIVISGKQQQTEYNNGKVVHVFKETIESYKINSDLQYLSYYSNLKGSLSIIDLKTKTLMWEEILENPIFLWHPLKEELTIGITQNNKTTIYNLDLNKREKTPEVELINAHLHTLEWSPDGEHLGIIKLQGLPDSHSYSILDIYDEEWEKKSVVDIPDINYINWSPDSRKIAFSQYINDYSVCKVGVLDIIENNLTYLPQTSNTQLNPIFSNDGELIYFSEVNGFLQRILSYNLKEKIFSNILDEPRYLTNFNWLNNQLVFSFGYLPQIKIYNPVNQQDIIISHGAWQQVVQNKLFFLKHTEQDTTCLIEYK